MAARRGKSDFEYIAGGCAMARGLHLLIATAVAVAMAGAPTRAQEGGCAGGGGGSDHGGGGGSGGGGCGDVFGDLVHIKRAPDTGQPILQKRWIAQKDVTDWGYCPIPVDAQGNEIPFAPLSCDPDPAYADALVEVDYFGRLSGGRTRERNIRMHFDEVIDKIKEGQAVDRDAAGRLRIGTGCTADGGGAVDPATCTWKTVDSPQENIALYNRILRYGHIQTDPLEANDDAHGDPALPTQYHVALGAGDYKKFQGAVAALLPTVPDNAAACFGGGTSTCHGPQPLTSEDFAIAASVLGGAADKTGFITRDLVQYLHRILKITVPTPVTAATLATLPALIRDCGADPANQVPAYGCTIYPAPRGLPAPADERFVDYSAVQYDRTQWFSGRADVVRPSGPDTWVRAGAVLMRDYLSFVNPGHQTGTNIDGFVNASLDGVRAVEFLHEYLPPADLGWDFATVYPDPSPPIVTGLTADLQAPQHVGRTIRFTALAGGGLAPLGFKWLLFDGRYWTSLTAWSPSNTFDWTPAAESPDYRIGVWVRDADSTLDAPDSIGAATSIPYPVDAGVRITAFAADLPSPQPAGTAVAFTVAAAGGTPPYEYKWWLFNGSGWVAVQTWTPSATWTWRPTDANPAYRVGVWVRSSGSTRDGTEGIASYTSIAFPIGPTPPLTVTGIAADLAAPQPVGTGIRFTAAAKGGTPPYQYRWWVFDGTTWTVAVEWTSEATFDWTPTAAHAGYRIGVWVRSAGSTQDTTETATSYMSVPFPVVALP